MDDISSHLDQDATFAVGGEGQAFLADVYGAGRVMADNLHGPSGVSYVMTDRRGDRLGTSRDLRRALDREGAHPPHATAQHPARGRPSPLPARASPSASRRSRGSPRPLRVWLPPPELRAGGQTSSIFVEVSLTRTVSLHLAMALGG